MDEIKDKPLPGTVTTQITQGEKGFKKIEMLLEATGGLSLSQVCAVTGLEGSTIQNWVKRGWVAHPKGKKYEEIHIARVLIINALKECIKLENIAQLMVYLNGSTEEPADYIVRERDLYNYLCSALGQLGQVDDLSRSGVESVVDSVIIDYKGPTALARARIRKALTVMIYACVCTDVKRRTEAMMLQILNELENPDAAAEYMVEEQSSPAPDYDAAAVEDEPAQPTEPEVVKEEARKTVAQALREWDLSRVESIINEENDSDDFIDYAPAPAPVPVRAEPVAQQPEPAAEKPAQKPWYFRRN